MNLATEDFSGIYLEEGWGWEFIIFAISFLARTPQIPQYFVKSVVFERLCNNIKVLNV
jgi:hypothetical protein